MLFCSACNKCDFVISFIDQAMPVQLGDLGDADDEPGGLTPEDYDDTAPDWSRRSTCRYLVCSCHFLLQSS